MALLQRRFYKEYNAKKSEKSFLEFTKAFIINQGWKTQSEIDQWIKDADDILKNEQIDFQTLTGNNLTIRDVALEHSSIFDDEEYYHIYLRELQEAHFAVGASDLLRYQILITEGGIYLDTDVLPLLEFDKIVNNESSNVDWKLIVNELMKLIIFKKLDDNNLQILKNKIDKTNNIESWKNLSFKIKDLIWENYIKESVMPLDALDCGILKILGKRSNAYIISNRKSWLLKDVQYTIKGNYQRIWESEEKIINNLLQKLVSNLYVLFSTGPGVFPGIPETDYTLDDVCSLRTLNAGSTWLNTKSEDFVSFEDLKKKYILQRLLSDKTKPDVEELKKYQKWNETELSKLTNDLSESLKLINELKQELAIENLKKESESKSFAIENQIDINTQWSDEINQILPLLSDIQKMISEKILLQNSGFVVCNINQTYENQKNNKVLQTPMKNPPIKCVNFS